MYKPGFITRLQRIISIGLIAVILTGGCAQTRVQERTSASQVKARVDSSYVPTADQRAFLTKLERDTFNFFWQTTNPENGLTPDRAPDTKFSSIAAVGFSLSSYLVGVEKGYISRDAAAKRTLTTLKFFWNGPQGPDETGMTGYKGFFYHFLDMDTGERYKNVELSTIDTSLLLAGILSSQTYFDKSNPREQQIRALADSIYKRVDWTWFEDQQHAPLLKMGWHPGEGFGRAYWHGYNEGMILYILALGSPTHPVDASAWSEWTSDYNWAEFYGQEHVNFGPLFGHQYSQVWVDFRGIQDEYMKQKGIDYFINSRRATLSNRAYCIDNPDNWTGYTGINWGLTASDGPGYKKTVFKGDSVVFQGYSARGASVDYHVDDGTIVPTAAGGSVPFAPSVTIPTLKHFYDAYGDKLYGKYGFRDAFNLSYPNGEGKSGWFDDDYLGIDQGPILLMIENYRSDFLWDLMKKNKYVRRGLKRAGFSGGWLQSN